MLRISKSHHWGRPDHHGSHGSTRAGLAWLGKLKYPKNGDVACEWDFAGISWCFFMFFLCFVFFIIGRIMLWVQNHWARWRPPFTEFPRLMTPLRVHEESRNVDDLESNQLFQIIQVDSPIFTRPMWPQKSDAIHPQGIMNPPGMERSHHLVMWIVNSTAMSICTQKVISQSYGKWTLYRG